MKKNTIISILVFGFGLGMAGCKEECANAGSTSLSSTAPNQSTMNPACLAPTPTPTPSPSPSPTPTNSPQASYYPPSWEAARSEGKVWSAYVMNLVKNELATQLMPGADDMDMFCPKYDRLNNDQRANVWALLISAVVKYESDFDPLSRMKETTMGTDPITGQHVYSEGLLQLSYQDIEFAPYCKFDWNRDRNLSPTDPNKTILNPQTNLYCGIRILADQIKDLGVIAAPASHAYWAVLIPNGKYTELDNIISLTKRMPGCQ